MAPHHPDAKHMQELLWQKWEKGVFSTSAEVQGGVEAAASGVSARGCSPPLAPSDHAGRPSILPGLPWRCHPDFPTFAWDKLHKCCRLKR